MYVGMIETRSLKILLKSFCENYSDLFKKKNTVLSATIFSFAAPLHRFHFPVHFTGEPHAISGLLCIIFLIFLSHIFYSFQRKKSASGTLTVALLLDRAGVLDIFETA